MRNVSLGGRQSLSTKHKPVDGLAEDNSASVAACGIRVGMARAIKNPHESVVVQTKSGARKIAFPPVAESGLTDQELFQLLKSE